MTAPPPGPSRPGAFGKEMREAKVVDQTRLRAPDVYGRTFEMDAAALAAMAERLEARGRHPFTAAVIDEYMAGLIQSPADAVLDLGCGTGAVARAVARRPEMGGTVTAVDVSAHLLERAKR